MSTILAVVIAPFVATVLWTKLVTPKDWWAHVVAQMPSDTARAPAE